MEELRSHDAPEKSVHNDNFVAPLDPNAKESESVSNDIPEQNTTKSPVKDNSLYTSSTSEMPA